MGGNLSEVEWKLCRPMPICLRLLLHDMRAAASRTFCTAGSKRPMRMAMIAITTNNSIKVKPGRRGRTGHLLDEGEKQSRGSVPQSIIHRRAAGYPRIRLFVLTFRQRSGQPTL